MKIQNCKKYVYYWNLRFKSHQFNTGVYVASPCVASVNIIICLFKIRKISSLVATKKCRKHDDVILIYMKWQNMWLFRLPPLEYIYMKNRNKLETAKKENISFQRRAISHQGLMYNNTVKSVCLLAENTITTSN